jgi:hypothetical protein
MGDEYENMNPFYRAEKKKTLMSLACDVNNHPHGLLVNGKYVVAISKNKWKVVGKNVWYWYSDLETFVEKYVLNNHKWSGEDLIKKKKRPYKFFDKALNFEEWVKQEAVGKGYFFDSAEEFTKIRKELKKKYLEYLKEKEIELAKKEEKNESLDGE